MNTAIYTNEEKWKVATTVVDELQHISSDQETTTEDLMKKLGECFPKDFPVKGSRLSVVYKPYLTPINYKVLVLRSQPQEFVLMLEDSPFVAIKSMVVAVISDDRSSVLETNEHEELSKLLKCTGLIIVPMRVDRERIIGAFILESTLNEQVLTEDDKIILDRVSDRLAFLIQFIDQKKRSQIIHNFLAELTENATSFDHESCILKAAINNLSGYKDGGDNRGNSEPWFSKEELSIILRHPFYNNQVYLVCENGDFSENFRDDRVVGKDKLNGLLGKNIDKLLETKDIVVCNDKREVEKQGLPSDYVSYAICPMAIRDRVIGIFVLRKHHMQKAYQDEKILLEQFSKFTAIALRDFRANRFSLQKRNFRKKFIQGQKEVTNEDLYSECYEILKSNFGYTDFSVLSINRESNRPQLAYPNNREIKISVKLKKDIQSYIKDVDKNVDSKKASFNEVSPVPIKSNGRFSIFSTRAESGRLTNVILIGSNYPLGKSTTAFLKELFATVSFKQSLDRKKKRLIALTEFGKAITAVDFNYKTYLDKIYELIEKYVSKHIYMDNIYISLLKDNEVQFPLFIKKTENGLERLNIDSRPFNKNTQAPARTEWILINKKPIIINSKDESIRWYKEHGESEKINDPFASWVGVPILEKTEAIGVIAAFHPTADYLHTDSDILFLENIAVHISSLLSRLNNKGLEEANRKLEEAIDLIRQQEESSNNEIFDLLSDHIEADLRKLKEVLIYLNEDINEAKQLNSIDKLRDTVALYEKAKDVINHLEKGVSSVKSKSKHKEEMLYIDLIFKDILKPIVRNKKDITIKEHDVQEGRIAVYSNEKYIFRTLWIIASIIDKLSDSTILVDYSINIELKSVVFNINIKAQDLDKNKDEVVDKLANARKIIEILLNGNVMFSFLSGDCENQLSITLKLPSKRFIVAIAFSKNNILLKKSIIKQLKSISDLEIIEAVSGKELVYLSNDDVLITDEESLSEVKKTCAKCVLLVESVESLSQNYKNIYSVILAREASDKIKGILGI